MAMLIDLSSFTEYTPYEGLGSSALLKQDGFYKAKVTKVTAGKSKTGNEKFTVVLVVEDEDEKGALLITDVLVGGQDKNGKPNARRFIEFVVGCGVPTDTVKALAARGTVDVEEIAGKLVGRSATVEVEAEVYNGRSSSKVQNFIYPPRYTDAVAVGAHRKPHKAAQSFATTTITPAASAVTSTASIPAIPAGAMANGAGGALDMLKGLGL